MTAKGGYVVVGGLDDEDRAKGATPVGDLHDQIAAAVITCAERMNAWWDLRWDPESETYRNGDKTNPPPRSAAPDYPLAQLRKQGRIDLIEETRLTALAYRIALMCRDGLL